MNKAFVDIDVVKLFCIHFNHIIISFIKAKVHGVDFTKQIRM